MAIQTQRSLAQLKAECTKLGLSVVQSGNRESKTDYIMSLREFYINELYPDGMPRGLNLFLQIESPMLAAQSKHIDPEEMEKIWNSKEWIAQEKIDGARMVEFWSPNENDFDCFSRNISVKDYLPVSYRNNVYMPNVDFSKIKDEFLLDSEIVCNNPSISTIMGKKGVITETQLQAVTALLSMETEKSIAVQMNEDAPLEFKAFDCLWWNGEWLLDKPYLERAKITIKAVAQLKEAGVNVSIPVSSYKNKKAFYKAIVSQGGEGVILKNLRSKYIASSNRSKTGFLKVKRTASEALGDNGMGDTVDGWISGYEIADETKSWAGLIGSVEISTTVRRKDGTTYEHKIARISNIDLETRKEMTRTDENGQPTLKTEWYGKVCEVDGQCFSARAKRLKHAILVRFRPDKSADACILEEEFIEKNIL